MKPSTPIQLSIEGGTYTYGWGGFTSEANRHKHYMKHVARVNETDTDESEDPEQWHHLWPESPALPCLLAQRRKETRNRLRACVPRCPLASRAPTEQDVCLEVCKNKRERGAVSSVTNEFGAELDAYESIVTRNMREAIQNTTWKDRAFFTRKGRGPGDVEIITLSEKRLFAVGVVVNDKQIQIITGYRLTNCGHLKSLRTAIADLQNMVRAAKASGKLLRAEPAVD